MARIDIEAKKDANLTSYSVGDAFVDIDSMNTELYSSVAANTAKTGITTVQAAAIAANTAKTGITTAQTAAIVANTEKTAPAVQTVTTTGASTVLDLDTSTYHAVTIDQDTAITVTHWPASGTLGKVMVRITNGGAYTVTVCGKTLPLTTSGTDQVVLFTENGGTTIYGGLALAGM